MKSKLLAIIMVLSLASCTPLIQYYCGFSGSFCGQSSSDDTNANASLIILAFANINTNGSIAMDQSNFPCSLVSAWQKQGKKVFLSIGGQNANWAQVFASNQSQNNAISSIQAIMGSTTLDGIDLDIQSYSTPPSTVGSFIRTLKSALRGKYLSVAPQCVGVYQGAGIPDPNVASTYWNYWVPIFNTSMTSIDLVMVQAYNNWYDGLSGGSLSYLQDIYLQWLNLPSPIFCDACVPIKNWSGVPQNKLAMGILASPSAGEAGYYANTSTIQNFIQWTKAQNLTLLGMMMWDTHWDNLNGYQASNAVITGSGSSTPVPPNPPNNNPMVCPTVAQKIENQLKKKQKPIFMKK